MISFTALLDCIYRVFVDFYDLTNSIYPFAEFDVSLFWMMAGTVITGIIWRIIASNSNFGEDDED